MSADTLAREVGHLTAQLRKARDAIEALTNGDPAILRSPGVTGIVQVQIDAGMHCRGCVAVAYESDPDDGDYPLYMLAGDCWVPVCELGQWLQETLQGALDAAIADAMREAMQ